MYASGKHAKALCDRCGLSYDYLSLQEQVINQRASGLMVCEDCLDIDHEQLGTPDLYDPIALHEPRPPNNLDRGLFGFDPSLTGMDMDLLQGSLRVTIS